MIFPWSVHSQIRDNLFSPIVAPTNGMMFVCRRCFQTTASLQNFCALSYQYRSRRRCARNSTYTETFVKRLWNVEADEFNSDLPAIKLALVH
jgi:hypothetical protein